FENASAVRTFLKLRVHIGVALRTEDPTPLGKAEECDESGEKGGEESSGHPPVIGWECAVGWIGWICWRGVRWLRRAGKRGEVDVTRIRSLVSGRIVCGRADDIGPVWKIRVVGPAYREQFARRCGVGSERAADSGKDGRGPRPGYCYCGVCYVVGSERVSYVYYDVDDSLRGRPVEAETGL